MNSPGDNIRNFWVIPLQNDVSISVHTNNITGPTSCDDYVYVNGAKASSGSIDVSTDSVAIVSTNSEVADEYGIVLTIYNANGSTRVYRYTYTPDLSSITHSEYGRYDKMSKRDVSYGILRVNPKLTGNIKVVVDPDYNIYIDTFKVSDILADRKYRKRKVDYRDYYGKNVMSTFSSIPSSELYLINPSCYNIFTAPDSFDKQYYDVYNYGVRTNADRLYGQNFAYLAPLRIKDNLPEAFIIMKVPACNSTVFSTEKEKIDYFIQNGKLVKSFDMRKDTILGTYIRNIQSHASKKTGDLYVAYDHRNMDICNGISIDRGVITSAYESPYSADSAGNQVAMNDYRTLSFERNRLISKDIINLEFMFDDDESEQFEICTYIGLYVSFNGDESSFSVMSDRSIYGEVSEIPESYTDFKSIIYGVSTRNDFIRLDKSIQTDLSTGTIDSVLAEYADEPDYVVCNADISQHLPEETTSFITVNFNKELKPGNHIRIIQKTLHKIYEVICSNMPDGTVNGISDTAYNYYMSRRGDAYDIERIQILIDDSDELENQISLIETAFKQFGIVTSRISSTEIGFISDDSDSVFEEICSVSGFEEDQALRMKTNEDDEPITVFGFIVPEKSILDVNNSTWESIEQSYLFPMHFELTGNRTAYIARFIKSVAGTESYLLGNVNESILNSRYLLYKDTNDDYKETTCISITNDLVTNITVTENVTKAYAVKYVDGRYMTWLDSPVMTRSQTALMMPRTLTQHICAIHPLKDYVTEVYDSKSSLTFTSSQNIVGTPGEYSTAEFDGSIARTSDEEEIGHFIDKNDNDLDTYFALGHLGVNPANRNDYYKNLSESNVTKSSISLVVPSTCKWAAVGTDHRGKRMRLMHDTSTNLPSNSYYIPCNDVSAYTTGIKRNLGFLSLYEKKGGGFDYSKYVQNSPYTLIAGDSAKTIEDCILYGNSSISEILADGSTVAMSSEVYSCGVNSIGFISAGIKFTIKSSNDQAIDLSEYIGYSAIFLTVPAFCRKHAKATEFLVDEIHKEICLVWYSCNETLDVSDTYTSPFIMAPIHGRVQDHTMYGSNDMVIDSEYVPAYASSYINDSSLIPNGSKLIYDFIGKLNEYAKIYDVTMTGDISIVPSSASIAEVNPSMHVDGLKVSATNTNIEKYTNDIFASAGTYIADMNYNMLYPYRKTLSDLVSDLSSVAILIRKEEGAKDYTTLKDILTIGIESPYMVNDNHPVIPAYMEPVMTDMLSFDYDVSTCISDAFKMSFRDSNTTISNVAKLSQVWINKVTPESNFCICSGNYKLSIDVLHGISIMDNTWCAGKYRKYFKETNIKDERYESHMGYVSGLETNCYLNSRGVLLKNSSHKDVVIDSWANTKVYQKLGYIKFAVTDSLVKKIRFTPAYINNWNGMGAADTYKIKYITSTIFNYINITGKNSFDLYFEDGVTGFNVKDMSDKPASAVKVTNVKHELKYENGRYYMYVYPEDTGTYYASFTIKL